MKTKKKKSNEKKHTEQFSKVANCMYSSTVVVFRVNYSYYIINILLQQFIHLVVFVLLSISLPLASRI